MSWKKKILRGSAQVALGEAVAYAASFVRNMILARLLTKADFGIAATFAMMISLLEFSSRLGISRFVVRDKEGDEPAFVGAAHMIQAVAAIVSATLMLAVAWPMARLFGVPEHTHAFLLLSVIPLLLGFCHLDVRRFERQMNFGPSTLVEVISQVLVTAAAWPLARYFPDFRAVLAVLILKSLITCIASFGFARTPYRWSFHREYAVRMLRFGWPLVINGFLMFCLIRGDQFVVATYYSKSDLGAYAAAAALTTAPTLFFSRVFASVVLPVMAKAQDDPSLFERRFGLVIAIIASFSAAYVAGVIVASEGLMQLTYGAKYKDTGVLLAWLTAANAFRNLRLAGAVAAMAKGDSKNEMYANVGGALALACSFTFAFLQLPVWCIGGAGLAGELLACTTSFRRLCRRDKIPASRVLAPAGLVVLVALLAGAAAFLGSLTLSPVTALLIGILAAIAAATVVSLALQDSRQEVLRLLAIRLPALRNRLSRTAPRPAPQGSSNP